MIGTVEVGQRKQYEDINIQAVIELCKLVSSYSQEIWDTTLGRVLEVVAENARMALHAEAASLHFMRRNLDISGRPFEYVYEVGAGKIDPAFLVRSRPRTGGLGDEAISSKEAQFVPDVTKGPPYDDMKLFRALSKSPCSRYAIPMLFSIDDSSFCAPVFLTISKAALNDSIALGYRPWLL